MRATALLREATEALRGAGVDAPEWDAERLLRHLLGWERAALIARPDAEVPPELSLRFRGLVSERARRVPLQYLLKTQAFWKHEFLVGPEVLIPRPESELLVEAALALLDPLERPLLVDVGTGSGCIALSLAAERPDAEVHATELSPEALEVARANAARLGLSARVHFHQGDLLAPMAELSRALDLVVSNPPYVDARDRHTLAPEVRDHEPAMALFGLEPPARTYERLAREASALLRPGAHLAVEIGLGQEQAVSATLEAAGLPVARRLPDLQGLTRVIVARRPRLA